MNSGYILRKRTRDNKLISKQEIKKSISCITCNICKLKNFYNFFEEEYNIPNDIITGFIRTLKNHENDYVMTQNKANSLNVNLEYILKLNRYIVPRGFINLKKITDHFDQCLKKDPKNSRMIYFNKLNEVVSTYTNMDTISNSDGLVKKKHIEKLFKLVCIQGRLLSQYKKL